MQDLEHAKASDESHASFYFTKESHIYTFCNLVLAAGLPMDKKKKIPELDYGKSNDLDKRQTFLLSLKPLTDASFCFSFSYHFRAL